MHQVEIEFKRVQTFLFSVPRLRSMVGANVMLGETVRVKLCKLAKDCGATIPSHCFSDNEAQQAFSQFQALDPLNEAGCESEFKDDPYSLLERGIITRDGGHFSAVFPSNDDAEESDQKAGQFKKKAEVLVQNELPGIRLEVSIQEMKERREAGSGEAPPPEVREHALLDLPPFQVCEEAGNGPACCQARIGDRRPWVSQEVLKLNESGERFARKGETTLDIVGLLRDQLPLSDMRAPADFKNLCGGDVTNPAKDYLAVIHADGNEVGKRFTTWHKQQPSATQSDLAHEISAETFYYPMRVLVRRAVVDALHKTFGDTSAEELYLPYQLLMLGGDDLLLVCRAAKALDFVVNYADELRNMQLALPDSHPLTIGAGVVIASHSFPFHHLHKLAEALASSAKRLYRAQPDEQKTSVVDWMICTNSWSDEPSDQRRLDRLISYSVGRLKETLVLSGRPYKVLADSVTEPYDLRSLQGLLLASRELSREGSEKTKAARSQLRHLTSEIHRGRLWANLCFEELPKDTRQSLEDVGIGQLWEPLNSSDGRATHITRLCDLVELSELPYLSKRNDQVQAKSQNFDAK